MKEQEISLGEITILAGQPIQEDKLYILEEVEYHASKNIVSVIVFETDHDLPGIAHGGHKKKTFFLCNDLNLKLLDKGSEITFV